MPPSQACGMLTRDRAISGTAVLNSARIALEVLRDSGRHVVLIGSLPEQLAVLEGVLDDAAWELAWRAQEEPRDAS